MHFHSVTGGAVDSFGAPYKFPRGYGAQLGAAILERARAADRERDRRLRMQAYLAHHAYEQSCLITNLIYFDFKGEINIELARELFDIWDKLDSKTLKNNSPEEYQDKIDRIDNYKVVFAGVLSLAFLACGALTYAFYTLERQGGVSFKEAIKALQASDNYFARQMLNFLLPLAIKELKKMHPFVRKGGPYKDIDGDYLSQILEFSDLFEISEETKAEALRNIRYVDNAPKNIELPPTVKDRLLWRFVFENLKYQTPGHYDGGRAFFQTGCCAAFTIKAGPHRGYSPLKSYEGIVSAGIQDERLRRRALRLIANMFYAVARNGEQRDAIQSATGLFANAAQNTAIDKKILEDIDRMIERRANSFKYGFK